MGLFYNSYSVGNVMSVILKISLIPINIQNNTFVCYWYLSSDFTENSAQIFESVLYVLLLSINSTAFHIFNQNKILLLNIQGTLFVKFSLY